MISGHKQGIAILYAVLLTTIVLTVGLILMDIITKQIILSSTDKNSQIAYSAALRGTECFTFWHRKFGAFGELDISAAGTTFKVEEYFDHDPTTPNQKMPLLGYYANGVDQPSPASDDVIVCGGGPVTILSGPTFAPDRGSATRATIQFRMEDSPTTCTIVDVTTARYGGYLTKEGEYNECSSSLVTPTGGQCHFAVIQSHGYNTACTAVGAPGARVVERTIETVQDVVRN